MPDVQKAQINMHSIPVGSGLGAAALIVALPFGSPTELVPPH